MAISHVKSNTVANWTGTVTVGNSSGGTQTIAASNLVLPQDWNSAHNQFYTLTGNTTGNSTASGTNVVFAASGAASVVGSTDTIVFSSPVMSTFEPVPWNGVSTNIVAAGNATSGPVSFWPFVLPYPVSAGIMDLAFSVSFVTLSNSSGRQSAGINVGIYCRGDGASSTQLRTCTSHQIGYSITGNNSSYSISQFTTTQYTGYGAPLQTNSLGSNITSQYTGLKKIGVPVNSYMSAGQYWLGLQATQSTSSVNVGLSFSYLGNVIATQASAFAPMGSLSSAYTAGSNPVGGPWREGYGSWSSTNTQTFLPTTVNFTSISNANLSVQPHIRFWRT